MNNPTKRVYISTPLKPEKFKLEAIQRKILKERVFAFIPPTDEKNNPKLGAALDRLQLDLCDEVWVFGAIGRDCSWEAGYAQGKGIPVVFFLSPENEHVYRDDWMIFTEGTRIENLDE